MMAKSWILAACIAFVALSTLQTAPPAPYEVTAELTASALKEGSVVWYTSGDVAVSEMIAKLFNAAYPEIKVRVERAGAERLFQRIAQEYRSNIHAADVIETTDAVNFVAFKRDGWLLPAVPGDVARLWPANAKDAGGLFASFRAHLNVIGYNTRLVKAEEAPKSWADLLDPRWRGRMVKAHPGYSGAIMTSTFALARVLGWDYFEKLGRQKVLQVQSATEPPKKVAQGERDVMADGSEYVVLGLKDAGAPIEIVYPAEGTPVIVGNAGILKDAPHPAAAKLFYAFLFSAEAQQALSDSGGLRSFRPGVAEKPGRKPLPEIKLLFTDPAELEPAIDDIRKRYERYFGI